jgi:hypothetical protein
MNEQKKTLYKIYNKYIRFPKNKKPPTERRKRERERGLKDKKPINLY